MIQHEFMFFQCKTVDKVLKHVAASDNLEEKVPATEKTLNSVYGIYR